MKNKQNGFTIVELLIASAVFSFIILGVSIAVIQISRLYYKGIIISNTHTAAKGMLESITQAIQYENGTITPLNTDPNTDISNFCIGTNRFTYRLYSQQGSGIAHAMWRDRVSNSGDCNTGIPNLDSLPTNGHDMLSDNMRITKLNITELNDSAQQPTGLYKVDLTVIYGDDDLIEGTGEDMRCRGQVAGSQWCSAVNYSTMVFKRIN